MTDDRAEDSATLRQRLAETGRRAERLVLLARVGHLTTADLPPGELLDTAADAIHELLNYPYVALLLLDPADPATLVLRAIGGGARGTAPPDYRLPITTGITGAAARTRRAQRVDDIAADPRYLPIPGGTGIRAELAVPILLGERTLGVLNVEGAVPFTEEDTISLRIVADQLAAALANAQLFAAERRRAERLALIARVSQRIAARLDPDELVATTVEELHRRLGYDHVSLFLLDPADPGWLVQRARASRWPRGEATGYRQALADGLIGAAARGRAAVLVNDVAADPRYIAVPRAGELRAELAMPILLGDRLLGVLDLAGAQPFRDEDVTGIQIVAGQLAIAIDHARLFADTQGALVQTRLLYATSQRIGAAGSVEEVIAAYLKQVAVRGHYVCTIALYDLDAAGARIGVTIRGRWSPREGLVLMEQPVPYSRDGLDPPLDAGQTVAMPDVHADPRASIKLRELQTRDGRPALALIPLMARGRPIGLVILSYPAVHAWRAADLHPYEITAAQLATAIDRRRQQLLLAERGRQLAVLEERGRLARDLHDSVTQLLFSTTLIAQSLAPAWRRDPVEGERRVARLLELSQAALAEMRALLAELRPAEPSPDGVEPAPDGGALPALAGLRRDGLVAALRRHAGGVARDGPPVALDTTGYVPQAPEREEALFRITQEALNNVVKHARARRVAIRLHTDGATTRLRVADDGAGFPTDPAELPAPPGGLGLRTMRERAAGIGGAFRVDSAPGRGTTVEVAAPRADRAEGRETR